MLELRTEDTERVLAAAYEAATDEPSLRALRDLALVELVVGVGLRAAEARLLTLLDLLTDPEGAPHGVDLRAGDLELPFSATVALGEWLRVRADLVPAGRTLLIALDGDGPRPAGRADVPMPRAVAGRVLVEAGRRAGVPLAADLAGPDLTVLGRAPAGWCEDCGGRWYSRTMVEALQTLRHCPCCSGTLHTALRGAETGGHVVVPAGAEPQRVLGTPRPRARAA